MSSEWFKGTWGDLVELKYGKGLKNYKESNEEIPVFGTNGPVGFTSKALCDFPSIIIGRKGAYRGVHFSSVPFWVIDTAYFVVPKKDFNIKWAYYHLLTQDINALDSGSAIPSTSREDFYQLPVNMPPRWIQDEIVNNLDVLNKKINLNSKSSQTLEEMAQAIFKSWFVDFDPVKAKMNGEQPEGMDEATASFFPDKLVESELGLIPEGWEVCLLNQKSEIKYGKNLPKTKLLDEGYPVFGGNGVIGYYSSYLYEDEQVLVSCRGAASGKVLRSLPKSFITNNSLVIDLSNSVLNINYVEPYLKGCNLEEYTSGSAQPQMTVANMAPVQILVPSEDILKSFDEVVKPLKSKIRANERQNLSLAALRDTLLPKLLSGEIELGQAQELAEVE
ncbi:TPA: restriction endonuclease subunit S [Vibrio parahaemolyticus]